MEFPESLYHPGREPFANGLKSPKENCCVRVLVTGGAGYIGSHTAKALAKAGIEPVVYDNLSEGHSWAVQWGPLVEANLADRNRLREALEQHSIEAVIHFAAHAYVSESMREPRKYFQNNVTDTLALLDTLLDAGIGTVVFSSSCAVYGIPAAVPIAESSATQPLSPYGESKLFVERALHWYGAAYGLRSACLRYFNAAGADATGELGELHRCETHIIPLVIESALGRRGPVEVFGTDYPTPDGTAIRDFVHVSDLADAHVLALQRLLAEKESFTLNLGTGHGISVLEIIRAVEKQAGAAIPWNPGPRRPGDPPALVADASLAQSLLGWNPARSTLDQIVASAWRWHHRIPQAKSSTP
jgi:UDP-arabinose 4-epimerase